jgi:hypothetical protein
MDDEISQGAVAPDMATLGGTITLMPTQHPNRVYRDCSPWPRGCRRAERLGPIPGEAPGPRQDRQRLRPPRGRRAAATARQERCAAAYAPPAAARMIGRTTIKSVAFEDHHPLRWVEPDRGRGRTRLVRPLAGTGPVPGDGGRARVLVRLLQRWWRARGPAARQRSATPLPRRCCCLGTSRLSFPIISVPASSRRADGRSLRAHEMMDRELGRIGDAMARR